MSQTRTSEHQLLVAGMAGISVLALGAPIAFSLVFGLMTGWIISVATGALAGDEPARVGSPWQVVDADDWWAVERGGAAVMVEPADRTCVEQCR